MGESSAAGQLQEGFALNELNCPEEKVMKNRVFLCLTTAALVTVLVGCEAAMIEGDSAANGEEGSSDVASSPGRPLMRATTLEAGTPLRVRTTNALSTASVKTGEAFAATLEEPIVDGSWVIAVKGSSVRGVIANADPGGKVRGTAGLSVRLTQIQTADGQNIDISTNTYGVQARSSQKKDAKKIGIASGVGAAIGAIVGGGKGAAIGAGAGAGAGTVAVVTTCGEAAVIGSESVLTFELAEPVRIQKN